MAKRSQNEQRADTITEHAAQHGDYARVGVVVINHGGTAIERWLNARPCQFTDDEVSAIKLCQNLWDKIDRKGKGPSEARHGGYYLWLGQSEHEAMAELALLRGSGRERIPDAMWNTFENVCRFRFGAAESAVLFDGSRRSAIDAARIYTKATASILACRLSPC